MSTRRFRLLATSDLHGHVLAHDYAADAPAPRGLARLVPEIDRLRAEADLSMLVDCGDILQGTPFSDDRMGEPGLNPMITAMAAAGYDAATLGNHDFNFGLAALRSAVTPLPFPIVLTNVAERLGKTPLEDQTLFPATAVLEREIDGRSLKIGLLGLCPPQIDAWDRRHLAGQVEVRDMVEAAAAWIPALRAQADLVIGLFHCGIDPGPVHDRMEQAALPLAALGGLDAMVLGHQHKCLPGDDFGAAEVGEGTVHGIPAVMAGFWGHALGVIDLDLDLSGAEITVAGSSARLIHPAPDAPEAPRILEGALPAHAATCAALAQPVGETKGPITSHFALAGDCPAVQVVGRAMCWAAEQELGDQLPIVAVTSPFRSGGPGGPSAYTDIAPGSLSRADVADLYPYPNALAVIRLTGAELTDWLDRSATLFCTFREGDRDGALFQRGFPLYNFDVCIGATYAIDLTVDPAFDIEGARRHDGSRIRDLSVNGEPVAPDMPLAVVSNSYRIGGGGAFPHATTAPRIFEPDETCQAVLSRWFTARGPINPGPDPGWHFAPLDATALFNGPPQHSCPPSGAFECVGPGPKGFSTWRVNLGAKD